MIKLITRIFFLFFAFLPFFSSGQSATVSPYSRYGIGELQDQTGAQGFAMGKTGIALRNDSTTPYFINLKNPASYYFNRITTFEAGVLNNNISLSTLGQTHTNNNTYFGYFALAFPVGKYFGACLGITPMSSMGYNITTTSPIDSAGIQVDNANTYYVGSGGINNLFLGLAFSPLKGHLSMGAHLSYLFGNIATTSSLEYPPNYSAFGANEYEDIQVKSLYLNYGLLCTIGKTAGWNFTLGLTAALGSNVNATYTLLDYNTLNGYLYDTIKSISNQSGSIHMPLMLGGGLTIKKGTKWTLTGEYSMQNWSQYSYFGQTESLNDSKHIGIGLQFIPHKNFDAPHTYFQRVHYRIGFYTDQTYLDINNTPLNDYGVTLGVGFPIGRTIPMFRASILNIGMQAGQLGTTTNGLLQEKYIKLLFSFTFDDRWFIKRQYE